MIDSFERNRLELKEYKKFLTESPKISWQEHWRLRKKEVLKEGNFLKEILTEQNWKEFLNSDKNGFSLYILQTLNGGNNG